MTQVEQHQLDSLLDVESGLTEWELEFIENMDANWRRRELTEKQSAGEDLRPASSMMPDNLTGQQSNSFADAPSIADLHRIALACGWPRGDVHQMLHDWCIALWPECSSLKDLGPSDRKLFAAQIRAGGRRPGPVPQVYRRKPRRPHPRGRDPEPGVVRMASPRQRQLIKTLASEMRWSGSLLNDFLKTHFQADTVEALTTSAHACKAIQMLKAYKRRKECRRSGQ